MNKVILLIPLTLLLLAAGCVSTDPSSTRQPDSISQSNHPWKSGLNNYLSCFTKEVPKDPIKKIVKTTCPLSNRPNLTFQNCESYFNQSLIPALSIEIDEISPKNYQERQSFKALHGAGTLFLAQLRLETDQKVQSIVGKTSFLQAKSCLTAYGNYLSATRKLEDRLGDMELWVQAGLSEPSRYRDRRQQRSQLTETRIRQVAPGGRRQVQERVFHKTPFLMDSIPHSIAYKNVRSFREGDLILMTSRTFASNTINQFNYFQSDFDLVGVLAEDPILKSNIQGLYGKTPPLEEQKKYMLVYYASPQNGLSRVTLSELENSLVRIKWMRWYDQSIEGQRFAAEFANQAKNIYFQGKDKSYDFSHTADGLEPYFSTEFIVEIISKSSENQNYYDLLSKQKGENFTYALSTPKISLPSQFAEVFNIADDYSNFNLEIDPRFNTVAEWRSYIAMEPTNLSQRLLTSIKTWLQKPFNYRFNLKKGTTDLPAPIISISASYRGLQSSELAYENLSKASLTVNQKRLLALYFKKLLYLNQVIETESVRSWAQRQRRLSPSEEYVLINSVRHNEKAEWEKRFKSTPFKVVDDMQIQDFPLHLHFFKDP